MTKKYERTLFNGVTVRLKITATTGRNVRGGKPGCQIQIGYSAPTFLDDEAKAQSELDAFISESAKDMSRAAGGTILFGKVKIQTYEIENEKTRPVGDDISGSGEACQSGREAGDGTPGAPEATGDGFGGAGAHAAAVADNGEVVPAEPHPGEVGGTNPA